MPISLLSPIKVKDVLLKNRIVLPPTQTNLATKEGFITGKLIKHYIRYAPWCGLIIIEHNICFAEWKDLKTATRYME
ncbi:MAG: hypothetical protein ACTSXW_01580 [Candidatus Baldrarchaeia archaeon]